MCLGQYMFPLRINVIRTLITLALLAQKNVMFFKVKRNKFYEENLFYQARWR